MRLEADGVLRDRELVELLADDPALLALADALHCTRPARRRRLRGAPLAAAALVAAAASLALAAPWRSDAGVVSRALAATGNGPVLHLVTSRSIPDVSTIDLRSGGSVSGAIRTEVFFDASRKLERIVSSSPLAGTSDELHTATGDWVNGSPVYTCSWIAAHPAAAARARVSCPAGSSTRPQPPTLDPALAAFASGYRAALRSGRARVAGDGTVGGRPVHWLAIGADERVAIDTATLLPILVSEDERGRTSTYRVLRFESEPYAAAEFVRARPPATAPVGGQSVHGSHPAQIASARRLLGALALPPRSSDLTFRRGSIFGLVTGYAGRRPATDSNEVELVFRDGHRAVALYETLSPDPVAGSTPGAGAAPGTALLLSGPGMPLLSAADERAGNPLAIGAWRVLLRVGKLYVTVVATSRASAIAAARSLVLSR